jgi:hypothetical protein
LKKLLSVIVIGFFAMLLSGGFLIYNRYRQNPLQVFPFPYEFEQIARTPEIEAPIVIIGDRMGVSLGRFGDELAQAISVNLSKAIKVQSIAGAGQGLHRSIHQLESLAQWPQILIYHGGSEEFSEQKFDPTQIKKIRANFDRHSDDRLETLLLLYPQLSRILYEPLTRVKLAPTPVLIKEFSETEYLNRLETELVMYEKQLLLLADMAKNKNTLLILTTTPINPDVAPKKVCSFAHPPELELDIHKIRELLKTSPKMAYAASSKLVKQHSGNALLQFVHGQIGKRLGMLDEARSYLLEASAYDCLPWRATEIQNTIIRRVARDQQVLMFDFAKLTEADWGKNAVFTDEIFPHNLYYEKAVAQLGAVIKEILKL